MVTILIESAILIVLFTIVVFKLMYSNPLNMINDYPKAIRNKALELGIIKKRTT